LIWTAGVVPNPPDKGKLPFKTSKHGAIQTNPDMSVPDHPGVWALGDCASVPNVLKGGTYAPTAQNAIREGPVLARNILASMAGTETTPFKYRMIGQLAALGHFKAVGTVGPVKVSGFPAWVLWRSYYLFRLPRFEKRLRVAFDWTLDMFFGRDIAQLSTTRTHIPEGEKSALVAK
jgi:NADH:ubiquinone reductase (H+-translocating)